MTARVCPSCARPLEGLEQYRATVSLPSHAEHAMAERRIERRRAQWRDAKRRAYHKQEAIGALHSLSCDGEPHIRKASCQPIPVYSKQLRVLR